MKKKSQQKPIPYVKIYFTGKDVEVYKKIKVLTEAHGMSQSKIGSLAIRLGLPMLKRNLEGLLIDIESQVEDHEQKNGLFLKR